MRLRDLGLAPRGEDMALVDIITISTKKNRHFDLMTAILEIRFFFMDLVLYARYLGRLINNGKF